MRAQLICEKFTEESDPIDDMNIGLPFLKRFQKDIKDIAQLPSQNLKTLNFRDISIKLTQLRYIGAYLAMLYFEEQYGLKFEPDPHIEWGHEIGTATYKGYTFNLTWSTTMQSIKLRILKKGYQLFLSANCQSMRSLENNLLWACKQEAIPLPKLPSKK